MMMKMFIYLQMGVWIKESKEGKKLLNLSGEGGGGTIFIGIGKRWG